LRESRKTSIIKPMEWTTPEYAEIKMDAEIGSYQEDDGRDPLPFADGEAREQDAE
jgi:hypothetical protein